MRDGAEHPTAFTDPAQQLRTAPDALAMMFLDLTTYLPEDILTKVDRATMAVALEGRAPLLDYRVVEFAFGLPLEMKLRDGEAKWLLKRLLQQYLPEPLVQLPKRGFGAPVSHWLKGPLREWAEAQLDGARLRREGHFDAQRITSIWAEFQSGGRKLHTHVWNVLMFQAWLEWMNDELAKRAGP